jgi:hypothetical protein
MELEIKQNKRRLLFDLQDEYRADEWFTKLSS